MILRILIKGWKSLANLRAVQRKPAVVYAAYTVSDFHPSGGKPHQCCWRNQQLRRLPDYPCSRSPPQTASLRLPAADSHVTCLSSNLLCLSMERTTIKQRAFFHRCPPQKFLFLFSMCRYSLYRKQFILSNSFLIHGIISIYTYPVNTC